MTTKIDKDTWSKALYQFVEDDAEILPLEKATDGRTTLDDIGEALAEYKKLFKAGIASKAEILTLSRAFPDSPEYTEAAKPFRDVEPMVVGGPASVELIDREGHMITSNALKKAFGNYMKSFRTRNAMVLHSDVQVGWCLPAYISKGGQIFKSGVDDKGLFFVCELRDDTRIAKRVMEQVNEGKLKSYSIAGSATKIENVQKGLVPYMRVDDMELAEVTVCEKGVNQSASFDLLKAEEDEEGKEEIKKELPKIKKELFFKSNEDVDFLATFVNYNDTIINKAEDPLTSDESFTTLHNYTGRVVEHHRLLNEMKFPSEQPQRAMRYTPTVYGQTDEKGNVINPRPPGQVNEAGQHLGDRLDESAPSFHMSDKNKARKGKGTISVTKFLDFQKASKKRNKKSSGMKNLAWATGVLAALATRITPKYNPETASFEWN
jgi:HK97 family phage prohead protease